VNAKALAGNLLDWTGDGLLEQTEGGVNGLVGPRTLEVERRALNGQDDELANGGHLGGRKVLESRRYWRGKKLGQKVAGWAKGASIFS